MSSDFPKKSKNDQGRRKGLRDELQYLGQMASTETALFHQKAAEHYDMGITDIKAMSILLQEGSMTAGELATRLVLTTGAITNLIDRLEKRGLVRREADPDDRRRVIVHASLQKLQDGGNIYESIGETFDKLAQDYSTAQLELLVDFYKKSIELTKQEIARLPRRRT